MKELLSVFFLHLISYFTTSPHNFKFVVVMPNQNMTPHQSGFPCESSGEAATALLLLHHQSARHNNNTPRNNPQLFREKSQHSGTEDTDKYNFVV